MYFTYTHKCHRIESTCTVVHQFYCLFQARPRQIWQKVVAEGKHALDSDRLFTRSKERVAAVESLVTSLKQHADAKEALSIVTTVDQVKNCGKNLPSLLNELSLLKGESELNDTQQQDAESARTKLEASFQELTTFLEPDLKSDFDQIQAWIAGLWAADGDEQTELLSDDIEMLDWEKRLNVWRALLECVLLFFDVSWQQHLLSLLKRSEPAQHTPKYSKSA